MTDDRDEVYARPRGPRYLVRRVLRTQRAAELHARAAADFGKPAPKPQTIADRFGVTLPRVRFLEAVDPPLPLAGEGRGEGEPS